MDPASEWTREDEESLAAVVASVRAASRNAEAQPFLQFLQRGGRLPVGRLPPGALAGPPVYEVPVRAAESPGRVRRSPDFAGAPQLQSVSAIGHHIAAVSVHGELLCSERPREGLFPVALPWPATEVKCSYDTLYQGGDDDCFAVVLRRGGLAVCKLRLGRMLYGDGATAAPEMVRGLPAADPVVVLEAGVAICVALTASGAAYAWGHDDVLRSLDAGRGGAVRVAQLSGRRIRRLRCFQWTIAAETEGGAVLVLDLRKSGPTLLSLPVAAVAFPLRDWQLGNGLCFLDACGTAWIARWKAGVVTVDALQKSGAAGPPCTVRSVGANEETPEVTHVLQAALTECGTLWVRIPRTAADNDPWDNVSAAQPELPLGLLPVESSWSDRILLLPDLSCGKHRMRLFARIAVRLELPSDPLRTVLLRAAVQSCYLGGADHDPFWPSNAPAAGAAGAAFPAAGAASASAVAAAVAAAAAGGVANEH